MLKRLGSTSSTKSTSSLLHNNKKMMMKHTTISFKHYHPQIIGINGQSIEGLTFAIALNQLNSLQNNNYKIEFYQSNDTIKDDIIILNNKSINYLQNICKIPLFTNPNYFKYLKNLTHYHLLRADVRAPINIIDFNKLGFNSINGNGIYSIQKYNLIKILNDFILNSNLNIQFFNDSIRNVQLNNKNKLLIGTKKGIITKRNVDLLIDASEDVNAPQFYNELLNINNNTINGNIAIPRGYESDVLICPTPSDVDYESRIFEWWNNSSKLTIIPLPNNQIAINSIQFIPKNQSNNIQERKDLLSLQFIYKIHSNLRNNGIDSVLDNIHQLLYSRNKVGIVSHSKSYYNYNYLNNKLNNIIYLGKSKHDIDPTLFQNYNLFIYDAIQLAIQLNENNNLNNAIELFNQSTQLEYDRLNNLSEGMARIGFKKPVSKLTYLFKYLTEKTNSFRYSKFIKQSLMDE